MYSLAYNDVVNVSGSGVLGDIVEIAGGVIAVAAGAAGAILSDGATVAVTKGAVALVGVAMIVDGAINLAHEK